MFSCIFFPAQTFSIHDLIFAANAHADAHSDSECVDTQRRADKQITQTVHTRTLLSTDGRTAQGLAAALSKLFSSRSMNLHRSCCQVPRHRTRCREKAAGGVRATVSYTSALHAHLTTRCCIVLAASYPCVVCGRSSNDSQEASSSLWAAACASCFLAHKTQRSSPCVERVPASMRNETN